MKKSTKTMSVAVERTIPAPLGEVFNAWLNPKVPGTPWHEGQKVILNPKVDGLFYWLVEGTPHYGRFTKVERPGKIQHTWMSPYTNGMESTVTVTFKKMGSDTRMILVHSGLPDDKNGKAHEGGWTYFLDKFTKGFGRRAGRKA